MSTEREDGPVYYREIQKNTYLKRIPNELPSSKLIALGHKKPPLKSMWTQLCIHNGRTPYLEQYPEADHPTALTHRPTWRASLLTARHVTGSVRPRQGNEYDFLVDTEKGPVRMLAPDWETMQDWVTTLRNKLSELKIMSKGENVYCAPPVTPQPRAPNRDPTSPLPPTPPVPPDRVPGIEIIPTVHTAPVSTETPAQPEQVTQLSEPSQPEPQNPEPFAMPSTSQRSEGIAKICGQNICLDGSLLERIGSGSGGDFDEELGETEEYRQTVLVPEDSADVDQPRIDCPSNITVIQVSNREAPHTAIPIVSTEDVFDFDVNRKTPNFVNIVNTEVNVQNTNDYGTVFNDYGHVSTMTSVSLTAVNQNDAYERLCNASTSKVEVLKSLDKNRKSSLPNLVKESDYEFLFLGSASESNTVNVVSTNGVNTRARSSRDNNNVQMRVNSIDEEITIENSSLTSVTTTTHSVSTTQVTATVSIAQITSTPSVSHAQVNRTVNNISAAHVSPEPISLTSSEVNRNVSDAHIVRSHSQNAYENSPRRVVVRRVQATSPKRDAQTDKSDQIQPKPIWKRGLTEFSLLTRLRAFGQSRRQESPTRNENGNDRNPLTSPVKVVRRSRPEAREGVRRRSNSLSNETVNSAEPRPGTLIGAPLSVRDGPVFADYSGHVWICRWGGPSPGVGRCGDKLVSVGRVSPSDAHHAVRLLAHAAPRHINVLFHRTPLAKIYKIVKRDKEFIGIKLDTECNVTSVEPSSPASRAGLPLEGRWAVTHVNSRQINLIKGGEEEMNRLSYHNTELTVTIQPSGLVKKIRSTLKTTKNAVGLR